MKDTKNTHLYDTGNNRYNGVSSNADSFYTEFNLSVSLASDLSFFFTLQHSMHLFLIVFLCPSRIHWRLLSFYILDITIFFCHLYLLIYLVHEYLMFLYLYSLRITGPNSSTHIETDSTFVTYFTPRSYIGVSIFFSQHTIYTVIECDDLYCKVIFRHVFPFRLTSSCADSKKMSRRVGVSEYYCMYIKYEYLCHNWSAILLACSL